MPASQALGRASAGFWAGSVAAGSAAFWAAGCRIWSSSSMAAARGNSPSSWVGTGPNKDIAPHQVEKAVGPDVLDTLAQQTGLSKDEILARLSRELPKAVDGYTPHGRLPTADELSTS